MAFVRLETRQAFQGTIVGGGERQHAPVIFRSDIECSERAGRITRSDELLHGAVATRLQVELVGEVRGLALARLRELRDTLLVVALLDGREALLVQLLGGAARHQKPYDAQY